MRRLAWIQPRYTMKKKYLSTLIRIVISFSLIAYFLFSLSSEHGGVGAAFGQFASAFSAARWIWLLPAFLLHMVGFTLVSLRWKIMLGAQGAETSFSRLFNYYIMAAFFNTFLPSTIGGDTLRAIESKKETGNTTISVMVVIVERLTGLMALVLIAACGLLIKISRTSDSPQQVWLFLSVIIAAFAAAAFCVHPNIAPKILAWLKKFLPGKIHGFLVQAHEAVSIYFKKPGILLKALFISVIFQLNMVLYYFLIATALRQQPEPVEFMMKVPIMIFLLMTVPAINGLGVRTAGFTGLMKWPEAYSFALECIDLVFRITYGLIGGLLFLAYRKDRS